VVSYATTVVSSIAKQGPFTDGFYPPSYGPIVCSEIQRAGISAALAMLVETRLSTKTKETK
jgi:hypothetical protein